MKSSRTRKSRWLALVAAQGASVVHRRAARTSGEAGLHPSNVHDCEYAIGAINFTGDFPVILTNDGPSLGGFVCPVTVARAELWKVGQLKPGDRIRFRALSFDEGRALQAAQEQSIADQRGALPTPPGARLTLLPTATRFAAILAERPADGHHPAVAYYGDNVLDIGLRLRVYLMMEALAASPIQGVLELSPGVRSLQVRYDSSCIHQDTLVASLLAIEARLPDVATLRIPTRGVYLPMAFEDSATLAAVERYRETVCAQASLLFLLGLGYVAAWSAFGLVAHGLHALLVAGIARVPALAWHGMAWLADRGGHARRRRRASVQRT